ncbi:MAG: hypothetical protein IJC75_01940 [Oscillospiraceae bacterium]|nr:hypothetical protein [Oscillospiraceae bacterium]
MMQPGKDHLKVLTRDMMKYLAYIPMLIGHMIAWINLMNHPENNLALYELPLPLLLLTGLSLFCPPVMFFFIADGYKYTKDRKKYALRLLLLACITQPFHWLVFQPTGGWWSFNVIFTLFFGLLSVFAWESSYTLWRRLLLVILCIAATVLFYCDWLVFGVLFILLLHIFRERPKARLIAYSSLALLHTAINLFSLGTVPALPLILYICVMFAALMAAYLCMTVFYNGKKGRYPNFAKWFFYVFYPLHYLLIWMIQLTLEQF